jgi:hypothetical protein
MSEDLCRRRKEKGKDHVDNPNQSPKYSKMNIASRTREKVIAGRVHAEIQHSACQASPETKNFDDLGDIEIQNNMFEKTASLGQFKIDTQQDWSGERNRGLENGKLDESVDEGHSRKHSSASRLREQVGLASRNNSPNCRMLQINDRLERFSLEDLGSSRTSPADRIRHRTGSNLSSKSNAEIFPEWFPSRENDSSRVEVVQSCQDEGGTVIFNDCSLLKPCLDLDLKGDLPPLLDTEAAGVRTPNSHRMRFKLPNLLPISFVRDKGEKASKASSRVESPVVTTKILTIDQLSPHRDPSPMTIPTSKGTRKSPLSAGSSLSATRISLSDFTKVKSSDSIDKGGTWDPNPPVEGEKVAVAESKKAWQSYLNLNDSVVTDVFAGQLQSTIECLTCKSRYARHVWCGFILCCVVCCIILTVL